MLLATPPYGNPSWGFGEQADISVPIQGYAWPPETKLTLSLERLDHAGAHLHWEAHWDPTTPLPVRRNFLRRAQQRFERS